MAMLLKNRKFRLFITFRVFLVLIFLMLTWYFAFQTPFWLVSIWMLLFAGWSLHSLFQHVEQPYSELNHLLLSLQQKDFTINFQPDRKPFPQLYMQMKEILIQYQELAKSKITDYQFFEKAIEHTGIPILAYRVHDLSVKLVNPAFCNFFNFRQFIKLDQLESRYSEFLSRIKELESGDKVLIDVQSMHGLRRISVAATKMKLDGQEIMILAMQNISSELEQQEVEAWQKLIRVLTHEIKNSVIPISTLSEVVEDMLSESEETVRLEGEEADDFRTSIRTISKRSRGLVGFVEKYSDLSRVPKPEFKPVAVDPLIQNVIKLFETEANLKQRPVLENSLGLEVSVDEEMIEQVLINLLKNAREALVATQDARISVFQEREGKYLKIAVKDNGPGMDRETQRNIFVPFYTTKDQGSGIGLSLSRQILRAHHGSLNVISAPGKGSSFELTLPLAK